MPRALNTELDALQLQERRRPAYIIEIFDIRSTVGDPTPTTINDVVKFNLDPFFPLPAIVGPRDCTEDVPVIDMQEQAGDFIDPGIASDSIGFSVIDSWDQFDPVTNPPVVDPNADGRWLRQGNVVRVREGDVEIDESLWPVTFTGFLKGQPGASKSRTENRKVLVVKAVGREINFLNRENTSINFVQSTPYSTMVETLATDDMGLSLDELNFPTIFGTSLTQHLSTQFVAEPAISSIAKILFIDGQMPRFEGDGRLGFTDGVITKAPVRVYSEDKEIIAIDRPLLDLDGTNKVTIVGLEADLTEVAQEKQSLATASLTTGFFQQNETILVFWSDDRTQQARDTEMVVLSSVQGIAKIGSESYTEDVLPDGLSLGGRIEIRSGFHPLILYYIFSIYVSAGFIPNREIGGGIVLRVGGIIQGFILAAFLFIVGTMGRGNYDIVGIPIEFVFLEIRCTAQKTGLTPEETVEIEIENHLVNDDATCEAIALRVLRRETARQNERKIEAIHDLRLVPDDVFETADGRRYMIEKISRTISRSTEGGRASYDCFEVTPGVRP
jgi:hypothetical protein